MLTPSQCKIIYAFMAGYEENPRIAMKELHKRYSPYRGVSSTADLLKRALDSQVFVGPRIFLNAHLDVELLMREDVDNLECLALWNSILSDPSVTYAVLLSGVHSLLVFRRGASLLSYAEAVKPVYPAKKTFEDINPSKLGKLPRDPYPQNWNELDWKIYAYMKYPMRFSFRDVGKRLDISWMTVRDHYKKIVKDCKMWHSFFPRGMQNYYHTFMTFQTDYEVGLRDELMKLDRTSFIYKFEKTISLFTYSDNQKPPNTFLNLEKEGIIHDLRVSIPIQWHEERLPV